MCIYRPVTIGYRVLAGMEATYCVLAQQAIDHIILYSLNLLHRIFIQEAIKRSNLTEKFSSQIPICFWIRLQESPWSDQISEIRFGGQESRPAGSVLEVPVWQSAAGSWRYLRYLWDRWKCCRMQGKSQVIFSSPSCLRGKEKSCTFFFKTMRLISVLNDLCIVWSSYW